MVTISKNVLWNIQDKSIFIKSHLCHHGTMIGEGRINYFSILDCLASGQTLEDIWSMKGQKYSRAKNHDIFSCLKKKKHFFYQFWPFRLQIASEVSLKAIKWNMIHSTLPLTSPTTVDFTRELTWLNHVHYRAPYLHLFPIDLQNLSHQLLYHLQ